MGLLRFSSSSIALALLVAATSSTESDCTHAALRRRQRFGDTAPDLSSEVPKNVGAASEVRVPDDEGINDFEDPPANFFAEQPEWVHFLRCAERKGESAVCEASEGIAQVMEDKTCSPNAPEPFFLTYKAWADKARLILKAWCEESASKAGRATGQDHTARFRACLAGVDLEEKKKACCNDELDGIFQEDVCGDPRAFPELLELSKEEHHVIVGAILMFWCEADRELLQCDEAVHKDLDRPADGENAEAAHPRKARSNESAQARDGQREHQGRPGSAKSGFWKRFQGHKKHRDQQ